METPCWDSCQKQPGETIQLSLLLVSLCSLGKQNSFFPDLHPFSLLSAKSFSICRFDAQCLKDIIDKYEENLGFEKSFISILAPRTRKEVEEMRRFYKKANKADMDADILK